MRQALTSSLVVHLTDSTTQHASSDTPLGVSELSRSLQVKGPVIILPDTLLPSRGFKDTSTFDQLPN